tara:strand:+ start:409 stop:558 length:150 start_codon:yes stop_codon:yes gene_type:complete
VLVEIDGYTKTIAPATLDVPITVKLLGEVLVVSEAMLEEADGQAGIVES